MTNFDQYALNAAAKSRPEAEELLFRNREKVFARAYRPILPRIRAATRILDFGCGGGELLLTLSKYSDARIDGFDPSSSQLAIARSRCSHLSQVRCTSDLGSLEQAYDLVFSSHVIEHIPDSELDNFLRSMITRLAPGGRLVITTPNGMNPFAYAFFMSGDRTHLRMHSLLTLAEALNPLGLTIERYGRELPQAYDLKSFAKTSAWWVTSLFLKLGIYTAASGARGLRYPLLLAPTFYVVAKRDSDQ